MAEFDLISTVHRSTRRDYVQRVVECDKAEVAEKAIQFGYDYWDGSRLHGYGGYHYDGRWRAVANDLVAHYGLKAGDRILDVGSGKGFLLHDFTEAVPGIEVAGLDISSYAIEHAMESVKPYLVEGTADKLPWPDNHFDFVVSINTLHNLFLPELFSAFREIERVSRNSRAYVVVESYRNEREKMNLMYRQLTCRAFFTPRDWQWIFDQTGYLGDHSFIYFE